jgi:hypothetical protein
LIDLNFITVIIYMAASAGGWWAVRRANRLAIGNDSINSDRSADGNGAIHIVNEADGWPKMLLWLGVVVHAVAIAWALFGDTSPGINIGFSHAISLIVWLTLVSYIMLGSDTRLTRLYWPMRFIPSQLCMRYSCCFYKNSCWPG